jgi:flavodoxin
MRTRGRDTRCGERTPVFGGYATRAGGSSATFVAVSGRSDGTAAIESKLDPLTGGQVIGGEDMKVLVVYDSKFGNTERIAQVIAGRLQRHGSVELMNVELAPRTMPQSLNLLVVGGPTQGHGASPALRDWLEGLEPTHGVRAGAFDTRFAKPRWLTGSAAGVIARRLNRLGFDLVRDPESFFVAHSEGPLLDGEDDRAAAWAERLANHLITEATFLR